MKFTKKVLVERKNSSFTTALEKLENTGQFAVSQFMDGGNNFNCVVLSPAEAIEAALIILKTQGIIPEVTTIEELEKQGKL
jgi:hypothetical protein